jgi:hypothetical protein
LGIVCSFFLIYFYPKSYLLYSPFIILIGLFIWFVNKYIGLNSFLEKLNYSEEFYRREKLRANYDLSSLYRGDPIQLDSLHPNHFHKDLDIFGKQGLYTYLDTTYTSGGHEAFFNKLTQTNIDDLSLIKERQSRILALSEKPIVARKILRFLHGISGSAGYTKLNWKKFPTGAGDYFKQHPWVDFLFKPWIVLAWVNILFSFIFDYPSFFALFAIINLLLYAVGYKKKEHILKKYKEVYEKYVTLESILAYLQGLKFSEKSLSTLFSVSDDKERKELFRDMKKINSLLSLLDAPLFRFLLNFFGAYDLWVIRKLEKFDAKYSSKPEVYFKILEYLDSILPFVNFKLHNMNTNLPEINDSLLQIEAESIYHPLIHPSKRISNPLEKLKKGETVLITGSNMSGKTTYLRTVGINCLLALCGSSVSANVMRIPRLQILSSIRNEDSLQEGISFFYAEVKRIAYILETSKQKDISSLVLIDEVLKGTNTRERLIASKSILNEINKTKSFCFVTTHDLDLAKKGNKTKIKLKHFMEMVENGKMSFDYKIRPGIVKSTNALKILSSEIPSIRFRN